MKPKVLVVDSERVVADTLAWIFEKRGFECKVAYTGNQAVDTVGEYCPHLLLCDVTIAGTEDLELVSRLTARCPESRVLLLLGHYNHLEIAAQWAERHPVPSRIVTKPILPDHLLREAQALLEIPHA